MSDDPPSPASAERLSITKLEAAQQQLHAALELWFADGDPVPIHTLAFSAYDVIHAISKKRNPARRGLLFDSDMIADEYRNEWAIMLKTPSGFFKHARNDPDGVLEFHPALSELFMTFAILGLSTLQINPTSIDVAFLLWRGFHNPKFFNENGRKFYLDRLSIEDAQDIRNLPKRLFLDAFLQGRNSAPVSE